MSAVQLAANELHPWLRYTRWNVQDLQVTQWKCMKVIIVIQLLIFSVFLIDRDHYYIHVFPRLPALICPVFHLEMAG